MGNGGVGMQWMLRIRKARREDARSIGACHYHCWQETYSGLISDEYLEAMNEAQNMERFEGLYLQTGRYQYVVLDGSQIVGFFDISPAREEYAPYEVQGLYLRKSYHGHGYGRTIMDHIKKRMRCSPILFVVSQHQFYLRVLCSYGRKRNCTQRHLDRKAEVRSNLFSL